MRHRSVADLMTPTAVSVQRGTPFKEIARLLKEFDISAVPVVDAAGRLIGILSRSDLIQRFLRRDHAIQGEILEEVVTQTLGLNPSSLSVEVTDGLVTLSGRVSRRSLVAIVLRLCQSVDGVVDVVNRLDYAQDDVSAGARTPTER
ncbi:CBS domain-containing protein [Streptomyces goshikiensis]|uniref:CBS domain-containing protein n=1 Tax=Streptomyces goshikiensis TaxID=1942 RepID=UPI0036A943D8